MKAYAAAAIALALSLCPMAADGHAGEVARTANIIFILADDLGWSDLGSYGGAIFETPHLDRLAGEGIRFSQAYAPAPICSASRAATLTGRSPARLGFEFVTKAEGGFQPVEAPLRAPPYTLDLPLGELTVAELLASAGYRTAFFGKWHVSRHHARYLGWSPSHGPEAQGFQEAREDFGGHPYSYWNEEGKRSFLDLADGEFPEDSMNRRAGEFIRSDHERPFFLMVSHFHVHTPVHSRVAWLYRKYLAKLPVDHPNREKLAHYGAMVTTLDRLVGDLVAAVGEAGLEDSTLFAFTSDNGGHPEFAGNAPLRGSKWNLYEGGIRVPLIIRWPGRVGEGRECDVPVSATDLLPTFAELAGAPTPQDIDGCSLLPLLTDPQAALPPRSLVWHFPYYHPESRFGRAPKSIGVGDGVTSQTRPHSALREGRWKLIHFYEDGRDELYDLDRDPSESTDRSQVDVGERVRLRRQLDAYLERVAARTPSRSPSP